MVNNLSLVENEPRYWEFIRGLRNDPKIASGFIQQTSISPLEQNRYMQQYGNCFHICLLNGEPVGFVGVIDNDIRIACKSENQRQGIAAYMLSEMVKKFPRAVAKIKIDNDASLSLFRKFDFKVKYYLLEREVK
jgi:RimJ/RimL family protein N-acetyltransferase